MRIRYSLQFQFAGFSCRGFGLQGLVVLRRVLGKYREGGGWVWGFMLGVFYFGISCQGRYRFRLPKDFVG